MPKNTVDLSSLKVKQRIIVAKEKERLYPLNIPIEICDENYKYFGKVAVRKLTLKKGRTTMEIEILKIFDENERRVYSESFIRP